MQAQFSRVGVFAKINGEGIAQTLEQVIKLLQQNKVEVCLEEKSATLLSGHDLKTYPSESIGEHCDLVIVIGGDGSLLKAARAIVEYEIPIVGVNRGNLGFLADVTTAQLNNTLTEILNGNYYAEKRSMLNATIVKNQKKVSSHLALNDVVLHHGDIARLIEFEIFIDDEFVIDQRGDGIIASTPTGSTAYALSGGGPIVYPTLDVLTLLPMFPHTLSARPIVVAKNSKIKLVIAKNNKIDVNISCDGQTHMALQAGDEVHIAAHNKDLQLLHPQNYNYYALLREKLGWSINLNR